MYVHEKDMFLVMAEVVIETLINAMSLPSDDEIFGRTLRGLWVEYYTKLYLIFVGFLK